MTTRKWLTLESGLLVWVVTACGGSTSTGSDTGSGGPGGSATSAANSGQTGGTGGTTSDSCPPAEPVLGSSCVDGQTCTFDDCESSPLTPEHTLTCVDSAWVLVSVWDCACPLPSFALEVGDGCIEGEIPGPCPIYDNCGTETLLYCVDGEWGTSPPDGAAPIGLGGATAVGTAMGTSTTGTVIPECPVEPPTLGAECCPANYPVYCDYGSGAGGSAGFGAPIPPAGGASGTVGSSTAIGSIGGVTTVSTTGSTSGSGGGSAGSPPVAGCFTCSANRIWKTSDACP